MEQSTKEAWKRLLDEARRELPDATVRTWLEPAVPIALDDGRLIVGAPDQFAVEDRKSTRLNSSHGYISYAVFCLKKKTRTYAATSPPTSSDAARSSTTGISLSAWSYITLASSLQPRPLGRQSPSVLDRVATVAAT